MRVPITKELAANLVAWLCSKESNEFSIVLTNYEQNFPVITLVRTDEVDERKLISSTEELKKAADE